MTPAQSPQFVYGGFSPRRSLSNQPVTSLTPSPPRRMPGSPLSASPCVEHCTLSFGKVPLPTSTAVSTDSEAGTFSSDWHYTNDARNNAQSPSLITSLFQTNPLPRSRQHSAGSASGSNPISPATTGTSATKPILRKDTFSTNGEEGWRDHDMFNGFVLGVPRASEEDQTATGQHPPKKNPSSLTFAVKPCPVSTDSEAGTFSSDWHCHSNAFPTQARQPPRSSVTAPTPVTSNGILNQVEGNVGGTKPILRRGTISTAEEGGARDGESSVSRVPECAERNVTSQPPLRRRPSALTFAVNPCLPVSPRSNAPYNQRSRSRSTSTSISNMSTRRSPPPSTPSWCSTHSEEDSDEDEDEEDEEDDGYVESPIAIPGHEFDSDEGYHEDEEDGFTSDEHDAVAGIGTFTNMTKFQNRPLWAETQWAPRTSPNAPSTPRRKLGANREHAYPYFPSTTDEGDAEGPIQPANQRGRCSIRILTDKPSNTHCSRHRSPPPPIITAPPAARSPSAAELCRRRGSASAGPGASASASASGMAAARASGATVGPAKILTRGWKSDDAAFLPSRREPQSATVAETGRTIRFPSVPPTPVAERKASLPLPVASGRSNTSGGMTKTMQTPAQMQTPGGRQLSTGGILRRDKLEEMEIARGKGERLKPGGGLSRSLDGGDVIDLRRIVLTYTIDD
ncbi:hypothetical protein I312_105135 [Cryptococcus bacillisporus CA1280]|uniref:uncharacterized protein n=1 Tax=Cryptococcus bacillisporus CA1280 TaxID=1296109 RepID=UPI003368C026